MLIHAGDGIGPGVTCGSGRPESHVVALDNDQAFTYVSLLLCPSLQLTESCSLNRSFHLHALHVQISEETLVSKMHRAPLLLSNNMLIFV